jgi:hypothetical protein
MPKLDDEGFVPFQAELVDDALIALFCWFRRHVMLRALDATCHFISEGVRVQLVITTVMCLG